MLPLRRNCLVVPGSFLILAVLSSSLFAIRTQAAGPSITSLSPTSGPVGASVTITGKNFGSPQGTSTVQFNGTTGTPTSWSATSIVVPVPSGATTGNVVVTVSGAASKGISFTVAPNITSLSPTYGVVGASITVTGTTFGSTQGSSTVKFNGTAGTPTSWSATSIVVPVPTGATTGNVVVTVSGVASNGAAFTISPVSIAVTPANSSFLKGTTQQLIATGTYSDGTTKDITASATWVSSMASVATINSAGLATGVSVGTTAIQATYLSVSSATNLTVVNPLLSLSITPTLPGTRVGGTQQFTATGTYYDGTTQNLTSSVNWSSSSTSVATINSNGLATGLASGTSTITARQPGGIANSVNLNVTATITPPTITASVTPAPNTAGWNTYPVTVAFTCAAGSSAVANCPASQTVSTEGANQVVSGTVTDAVGNSATASATVNIDKTRPLLTVTSPADGATFSTASVALSGTTSDALSGLSAVTCNGAPASLSSGSFSCNISLLNVGVNLVVVRASDVAGNVAAFILHLNLTGTLPVPSSLQITPSGVNMLVGATQLFTAIDEKGRPRTDATWTVSNTTIATITTGSSPVLTALAAGQVTLTANVGSLSPQTQVPISSLASLPPGTPLWSAPPPGFSPQQQQLVQAVPTNIGPDIYSIQTGTQILFQALTADGRQLWQNNSLPAVGPFVPDALGGILVPLISGGSRSLMDIDGQTGMPVWQVGTQNPLVNFTIRPDGSIVAFETEPGALNAEGNPDTRAFLDVFDGSTGQLTLRIPLQQLVQIHQEPCQPLNYVTLEAGPMSPVIVDGNGNINLEYQTGTSTFVTNSDCQGTRSRTIINNTNTVLLTVSLDGSVSSQTLRSDTATTFTQETWVIGPGDVVIITSSTTSLSGSYTAPGRVIPDGQGGALATWSEGANATVPASPPIMVTHLSPSGGGTYSLPMVDASQLVAGENGVAFAAQNNTSQKVVSFNISSGQVLWTYEAPAQSIFSIVASAAGNGLVAKLTDQNGTDQVIRFNSNGTPTNDTWAARGIQYFGNGVWLGGAATALFAAPFEWGNPVWPVPDGDSEGQNASRFDLELVWCANGACSDLPDTNQDVVFFIQADDAPHTTINLSSQQKNTIRLNALNALKLAFAPYKVNVGTGRQGSNTIYVVGTSLLPCGQTENVKTTWSRIFYPPNMMQAQHAVNVTTATPTPTQLETLVKAIGEGIGNNAAHEIGHQLVNAFTRAQKIVAGADMDDGSVDTYNGSSCADPAVFTGVGTDGLTPIHWSSNADQSWTNIFGKRPQ